MPVIGHDYDYDYDYDYEDEDEDEDEDEKEYEVTAASTKHMRGGGRPGSFARFSRSELQQRGSA